MGDAPHPHPPLIPGTLPPRPLLTGRVGGLHGRQGLPQRQGQVQRHLPIGPPLSLGVAIAAYGKAKFGFRCFWDYSTRAFALKLDVFLLVRKTCALTMNVKDWLLIAFSWSVIKDTVTPVNLIASGRSQSSLILCLALFTEGSPLDLLTDELRKTSIRRIISDYFDFIDNFNETSLVACPSGLFGIPVFILSASLQSLQVGLPDIDARTLKFLVSITNNYKSSVDNVIKDQCLRLFSETLGIISYLKHLYASNDIEQAIMEIVNIFISEPPANMYKCKPNLAHFVAGLIHMEISESDDDDAKSCAAWGLYHFLLKEWQWALSHLAVTAFGYFAVRTKCNQLWRFVPQDAALSYDLVSGVEANKERFMSEFRTFLNKEIALLTVAPNPEQLELLAREGLKLKQMVHKISAIAEERHGFESMEIDDKNQSNKKSKLPDGISRGVELLKSGLKIIGDGLSQWQLNQFETNELQVKYMTQFCQLEDAITHFEELAGSSEV